MYRLLSKFSGLQRIHLHYLCIPYGFWHVLHLQIIFEFTVIICRFVSWHRLSGIEPLNSVFPSKPRWAIIMCDSGTGYMSKTKRANVHIIAACDLLSWAKFPISEGIVPCSRFSLRRSEAIQFGKRSMIWKVECQPISCPNDTVT
jgi:hypothetical protein